MRLLGAVLLLMGSFDASFSAFAEDLCAPEAGIQLSGAVDAPWALQIQLNPKEIPLNAPFDAIVTVCTQSGQLPSRMAVDAIMPAHKHGMNYEPKTTQIDDNRYEVKNLVFHMPGIWRFELTAYKGQKPHRFTHDVKIQ